jgi:hypothetical protein
VRDDDSDLVPASGGTPAPTPFVATLEETGITAAHAHFWQSKRHLEADGSSPGLITSVSRGRPAILPVVGMRFLLRPLSTLIFSVRPGSWA